MSAAYIEVSAEVRYWEDAAINGVADQAGTLTPFRNGDLWCPVIRLVDGVFMDWPAGMEATFHFKVCDQGEYWLLDENRQRIAKWAGDYVPDAFLCPGGSGYGDYIVLQVDAEGGINRWRSGGPAVEHGNRDDDGSGWKRLVSPVDADKLLAVCKAFIAKQEIHCVETIYQTDRVAENACQFIEDVCNLVGYVKLDDEEGLFAEGGAT